MCYMSGSIQMENVYATENEAGVWQWLFGKNTTSIVLHNTGTTDGFVGLLLLLWQESSRFVHIQTISLSCLVIQSSIVSMCMLVCINPEIGEKIFFVLAVGHSTQLLAYMILFTHTITRLIVVCFILIHCFPTD